MRYIISQNQTILAAVGGKSFTIDATAPYYDKIKEAINNQDDEMFLRYADISTSVAKSSDSKISFDGGALRYNGALIDNSLSRRIVDFVRNGFKCDPLIKFLENCYENPNPTVIDRLYDFMENNCIMIDADGYVVGYKKVREDGYDYYSGTVLYEIGAVVDMDRENCDLDSRRTCSYGLHIGSKHYAQNVWHSGEGKVLILRTHPKDVTAIPEEAGAHKLRSCRVEVLAEYKGEEPSPVYYPPNYKDPVPYEVEDPCEDEIEPYEDEAYDGICTCSDCCPDVCDGYYAPSYKVESINVVGTGPKLKVPVRDSFGRFISPNPKPFAPKRDSSGRFSKK